MKQWSHSKSLLAFLAALCLSDCAQVSQVTQVQPEVPRVEIAPREQVQAKGKKWMISTQGKFSTDAAAKVMESGGNLIDAAIAASFVLGVERPQSTGIGGGGFLIYHEGKTGKNFVIDFRERAPALATPHLFLDAKKEVIPDLSVTGSLAVAVPGMVRGLKSIHARFGKLPWARLIKPASDLAETGFSVYPSLSRAIEESRKELERFSESKSIYLHEDGSPLRLGERLVQKNLSSSLKRIAKSSEDFYTGEIAQKIVQSVQKQGGILSAQDLKIYPVRERQALLVNWQGYQIVSMPPPSSGGIHVIQIIKMLEKDIFDEKDFLSSRALHLEAQAMQQAFADRARYLGDPDFIQVPERGLTDSAYLAIQRAQFNDEKARPAEQVRAGSVPPDDELNTSHLSLMDADGNAVVSTQTINGYFGSALVAEGTGIVMNNEMDDFSAKPGASNIFGATSTSLANQVEAHKTPLSSMSPTLVLRDGQAVLALGAPGGTRIITSVAQTILNYFVFHQDLYTSVAAPRIHEQWQPDVLTVENQVVEPRTLQELKDKGWKLQRVRAQSNVMAVAREGDTLIGVADPRDIGTSQGR